MNQVLEVIDMGFSVADAENVGFSYDGDYLSLAFIDWQENRIKVHFKNVLGFKYQNSEYLLADNERYDSTYIVNESSWVQEHISSGEAWEGESWKHYKLNFNAECVIEVLCSGYKIID